MEAWSFENMTMPSNPIEIHRNQNENPSKPYEHKLNSKENPPISHCIPSKSYENLSTFPLTILQYPMNIFELT